MPRESIETPPGSETNQQIPSADPVPRFRSASPVPVVPASAAYQAWDEELFSTYPAIFEYLTLSRRGGRDIETATFLFFCGEGSFKACVTDREANQVLWRDASTFRGLLETLEETLAAGKATWRAKKTWSGKK
jgi:hypothetical protein